MIKEVLACCVEGRLEGAYALMKGLCDQGYSAMDVITTLFRVRRRYWLGLGLGAGGWGVL